MKRGETRHGDAPRRTRDQERALHAYRCVEAMGEDKARLEEYRRHVNDLGAAVLRSGLCAALSWLERDAKGEHSAAARLLDHLAEHVGALGWPSERRPEWRELPRRVRALEVARYQLVTREALHLTTWLRRAAQAEGAHAGAT